MADNVKKEAITYCETIEEFLENNPGIDPALKDLMKPVVQGADDRMYDFILGMIFS